MSSSGYSPKVTTWTSMSTQTAQWGTVNIVSKVVESAESALDHVEAMDRCAPVEPTYVSGGAGWRWTWEYVSGGQRCVDTVRIY